MCLTALVSPEHYEGKMTLPTISEFCFQKECKTVIIWIIEIRVYYCEHSRSTSQTFSQTSHTGFNNAIQQCQQCKENAAVCNDNNNDYYYQLIIIKCTWLD